MRRRTNSSTRLIPRSCCTTPRPNSPMPASSASAPRSASPPAASMRAGLWRRAVDQLQVSRARLGADQTVKTPLVQVRPSPAREEGKAAAARIVLPPHAPGMRIGLFGGTFDPPHEAHLGACLIAMKRLDLDRVWWLVTPGN